jgi:predicted methyltransferase
MHISRSTTWPAAWKVLLGTAAAALVSLPLAASAAMDAGTEAKIKKAIEGSQRTPENKARDPYRHPLATLKALGLKDTMAVMEIWPSGGYWTEILAPVLKDKGRYVAAHWDPDANSEFMKKAVAAFKEKLAKDPASYAKTEVVALNIASGKTEPVKPGTMDMVVTFRNIHNWMAQDQAKQMFDIMYASLKPGGYLGVEEHRAKTDKEQDPKAASGYVREDYAIKLVESAGFKLVSKSEVNANPKDTKDYPKGVWTLPPNYREGDVDKAKYTAIGESDRFTLLFQKPKK